MLTAPYDINVNPLEIPAHPASRIELLFETCAESTACQTAFPNLRQQYAGLLSNLATVPAQVVVEWRDEAIDSTVDETSLLNNLLQALSFGSLSVEQAPQTLAALAQGDATPLSSGVNMLSGPQYWAANLAVQCQDIFLKLSPAAIEQAKAEIPPALADFASDHPAYSWRLPELCKELELVASATEARATINSTVPILAFEGAYDPLLPPPWTTSALAGFTSVYRYTVPNEGHFPIPGLNFCVSSMSSSFFENPTQAPDLTCLDEEIIDFRIPVGETTFTPRRLVTMVDQGITLEIPAAWEEEYMATGKVSDVARTAAFETNVLTITTQAEGLPLLQDKWWPSMAEVDTREIGAYRWTFYEGPIGPLVALAAITQAEDGRFYAVEALVDSTITDPQIVMENLMLPALETFKLVQQ